ncbi:polysaccharide deacetylase [Paenibacillus albiflavus]|uniref:Polysaccharide deacetylase n=1 Tax=Paenibacillus albiflavus TaxID=2545760 RepID=A0A4R4EHR1_9BACL|nr:polysaccharide deacetylase family protein [Paenibacillus albiflavus]TCZ77718.1 polysaccharide deacetylase [Paenibacillus albiflavus]
MSKHRFGFIFLLGITLTVTGCQSFTIPAPQSTPTPTPMIGSRNIVEATPKQDSLVPRWIPMPPERKKPEPLPLNQQIPIPSMHPSGITPKTKQPPSNKQQPMKSKSDKPKPKPRSASKKAQHIPRSNSDRKIAYLTFDDGPSKVTVKVLNTLSKYNVKATFFVIGNSSLEGRSLYKRIVAEGHAIGNHSYSHNYKQIYQSVSTFQRDVDKLNDLLEQTISFRPDIIRFPGGSNNTVSYRAGGRYVMRHIAAEVTKQGYQYFDWNVSSSDATAAVRSKAQIVSAVKRATAGQDRIIVLMHDAPGRWTTAEALPDVIQFLQDQGYRFEKLSKSAYTCQFLTP